MTTSVLHLMCGKIASGKSTLATALAEQHAAILIGEDRWLAALYPDEIHSVADYVRSARRVRQVLQPLVTQLLGSGVSVVLDVPANTVADRQWLRALADGAHVPHCLHYLAVDDDTCRIACITWLSMTTRAAPGYERAMPRGIMISPRPMPSLT